MANVKISGLTATTTRMRVGDLFETSQNISSVQTSLGMTGGLINPFPEVPPTTAGSLDDEFDGSTLSGSWTWVNQGAVTVNFSNSYCVFNHPGSSMVFPILVKAVPGSTPWTVTTRISVNSIFANFQQFGLILRDSVSTGARIWTWANSVNFAHQYWTVSGGTASNVLIGNNSFPFLSQMYLQIHNDGTNFNFYYSLDGITYITFSTAGVTSIITPNQVGLVLLNQPATTLLAAVDFFRQT